MRVAAVQFAPKFKDVRANLETMGEIAKRASGKGAELIVFPEMATAGYSFMNFEEAAQFREPMLAEKGPSPSLDHMTHLAKMTNAAIVWGFVEEAAQVLFNSQCLVLPSGHYVTYRKRNLWGNDFLWASKGDASPTIMEWRGKKIGLLICRDVRDHSDVSSDLYEPGDADIVAFSANTGGGFPSVRWVEFAQQNRTHLVVSNRYGKEVANDFGPGGICVIEPSGKVNCQGLEWGKPCVVFHDI